MSIYSEFMGALKATEIPYAELANKADVSLSWLYAVQNGDIKEPSLTKVEKVMAILAPKKSRAA